MMLATAALLDLCPGCASYRFPPGDSAAAHARPAGQFFLAEKYRAAAFLAERCPFLFAMGAQHNFAGRIESARGVYHMPHGQV